MTKIINAEDLRNTNLRSANLRSVDLRNADLRSADLHGANLRSVDLRNADLRNADLHGANLRSANLRSVDLRNANLRNANLRNANLRNANLRNANLHGAKNIRCISHSGSELEIAYYVNHGTFIKVKAGCFWDNTDELLIQSEQKYGKESKHYRLYAHDIEGVKIAFEGMTND
jgi:hypothetical protein